MGTRRLVQASSRTHSSIHVAARSHASRLSGDSYSQRNAATESTFEADIPFSPRHGSEAQRRSHSVAGTCAGHDTQDTHSGHRTPNEAGKGHVVDGIAAHRAGPEHFRQHKVDDLVVFRRRPASGGHFQGPRRRHFGGHLGNQTPHSRGQTTSTRQQVILEIPSDGHSGTCGGDVVAQRGSMSQYDEEPSRVGPETTRLHAPLDASRGGTEGGQCGMLSGVYPERVGARADIFDENLHHSNGTTAGSTLNHDDDTTCISAAVSSGIDMLEATLNHVSPVRTGWSDEDPSRDGEPGWHPTSVLWWDSIVPKVEWFQMEDVSDTVSDTDSDVECNSSMPWQSDFRLPAHTCEYPLDEIVDTWLDADRLVAAAMTRIHDTAHPSHRAALDFYDTFALIRDPSAFMALFVATPRQGLGLRARLLPDDIEAISHLLRTPSDGGPHFVVGAFKVLKKQHKSRLIIDGRAINEAQVPPPEMLLENLIF